MKSLLLTLAGVASVAAHGFVETITVGGTVHTNYNPSVDPYNPNPPARPGWTAHQPDLGFVEPNQASHPDVICHKQATPGKSQIPVRAGDTITVKWNTWPDSHKGPVIDYLANCGGSCTNANKNSLQWFKIAEKGLTNGVWAADELMRNGNTWDITIPSDIAPGNYVLRHEIIALHGAGSPNGAQLYPQCINFEVSGGGSARPGGTVGTSLYRANDPGILFNIYSNPTSYPIPGPPLYK
ncbi:Polysaccharide monooxygenase Cel61a-like protein [Hapsidospora chrysogenum ATCC 11550]|uniref:lytic cellulose monooxygenase (C4-dehydrogenating) n=1 Tax=Hapsidospora chrysogenum (strain ATCC 11550 / CBS 779.69 / DSM 880 / IAM 14645 / JCM 23072 / IMI 49137) TaxID=857340 RepID=A0A086SXR3_HAPC1|nr:Polysaccharide monooxygenase Cel61a-like protein [Hapsidospora chrysogenum ATCC 11550]